MVRELLEKDNVLVVIYAVARFSPLDRFDEFARQQDRADRCDLVGPLVALGDVDVHVCVVLHGRSLPSSVRLPTVARCREAHSGLVMHADLMAFR